MTRSSAEVRDIVNQTREEARKLDGEEDKWHQIEDGTFNYADLVPKELGEPVVMLRRGVTSKAQQIESILAYPLRALVDLGRAGQEAGRIENEQDQIEAFFAHALIRCDPSGFQRDRLRWHMVNSRYGCLWLSVNPYRPPKDKDERERYDETYWRWRYETLNPRTVGFLERDNEVTLACIEEEIPIIRLAREYFPAEDDALALEICQHEFPGLRATDGRSVYDGSASLRGAVRRYVIDDGVTICHYLDVSGQKSNDYQQIVEDYPNTWGRPSLIVFPGVYRPHRPMETRYEALTGALCEVEKSLTVMESIMLTIAGNPRFAEELPPDVAMHREDLLASGIDPKTFEHLSLNEKDREGHRVISSAHGALRDISTKLGVEFQTAYEARLKQWEELTAALNFLSPAPETIQRGTAASLFASIEAGMRQFEKAQKVIEAGITTSWYMIANDIATGGGSKEYLRDGALAFRSTGHEVVRKQALKAGTKYTLSPSAFAQFPEPAHVSAEIVDGSQARRAARVQLALAMQAQGLATPADVLDAYGESDVSGKLIELAGWNNAQMALSHGMATYFVIDQLKTIAIREGRDEQLMIETFMPQFVSAGMELPGGTPPTTRGTQYNAPATPGPPQNGAYAR